MSRIPCKKCPQCGIYNDFTIEKCECGKDLSNIEAKFIDTADIAPEEYGEIDTSRKVYVQKCSACGALNYTDALSNPLKRCYKCHKTRIAEIIPVEYRDGYCKDEQNASALNDEAENGRENSAVEQTESKSVQEHPFQATDGDDYDASKQCQDSLKNIRDIVNNAHLARTDQPQTQQAVEQKSAQTQNNFSVNSDDDDDNDDDDDDYVGKWPSIIEALGKKKTDSMPEYQYQASWASEKKDITLTAIQYGQLSFTVEAGSDRYMLGRSANQGDFLSQDLRVGNEHCYLFFRNGAWFVRDNNSKNGTAVNSRNIGRNGECMLSDGDELKLGRSPDSAAFRISIR